MYKVLFLLVSSSILLGVEAGLKAEYISAKMPQPMYRTATYYDGDDTIYLFGGAWHGPWVPEYSHQIMKYSITNETIRVVQLLPEVVGSGCVSDLRNNSIFIFGAWLNGRYAYRYYPRTNLYERLPDSPDSIHACATAKLNANSTSTFIFDSNSVLSDTITKIYTYDMQSPNTTVEFGTLPYYSYPSVVQIDSKVYFFGDTRPCCVGGRSAVTVLDLNTMEFTKTDDVLPERGEPKSVYDSKGGKIYIIGGYDNEDVRGDGILQLDPVTLNYTVIPVENFIAGNGHWTGPAMVYVEKLNRIYLFGGYVSTEGYKDDIRYIDLNNLDN